MRQVIFSVFLVVASLLSANGEETFSVDGFVYEYNGVNEVVLVDIEDWCVIDACEKRILHIPDNVSYSNKDFVITALANNILSGKGFDVLEELKLPAGLRILGHSMICNMTNLRQINLGNGLLGDLGGNFCNLPLLKNLELPDCLEYIGPGSFVNSSIETLILPSNLKSIQRDLNPVFCDLPYLSYLDLGGVEYVGREVFTNLHQLKDLRCTAILEEIAGGAFSKLGNLSAIRFDKREGKKFVLGGGAFAYCPLLKDVYVEDEDPFDVIWELESESNVSFTPSDYTLHVPPGCVNAFLQSPFWSLFGKIIGDNASVSHPLLRNNMQWTYHINENTLNVNFCNNTEVVIITMEGEIVYSVAKAPDNIAIILPQGIYIMHVGEDVVKFAVR